MTVDMIQGFDEFDEPDAEVKTEIAEAHGANEVTDKLSDELSPDLWGQLCFDLVMNQGEHDRVLRGYGLSEVGMLNLLENKVFCDRLKDAKLQVKTLGATAGFVLSARAQAERHLVTLGQIAESNTTHPAVRVKAIENMVRYAHLDPQTQKQVKENEQRGSSPGVLVQFNIGGGLLGGGAKTIEVQAEQLTDGGV
jgi:hypothetical protein